MSEPDEALAPTMAAPRKPNELKKAADNLCAFFAFSRTYREGIMKFPKKLIIYLTILFYFLVLLSVGSVKAETLVYKELFNVNNDNNEIIEFKINNAGEIAYIMYWWDNTNYGHKIYYYDTRVSYETPHLIANVSGPINNIQINDDGKIIWSQFPIYQPNNSSIYYYDCKINNTPQLISSNNVYYRSAHLSNNGVAWVSKNVVNNQDTIYYYNTKVVNETPHVIIDNVNVFDKNVMINNKGNIVWSESDYIKIYNDGNISSIYSPYACSPFMNDLGEIVWVKHDNYYYVYYYNTNITNETPHNISSPNILAYQSSYNGTVKITNSGIIAWRGHNGNIFYYNTKTLGETCHLISGDAPSYNNYTIEINEYGKIIWLGWYSDTNQTTYFDIMAGKGPYRLNNSSSGDISDIDARGDINEINQIVFRDANWELNKTSIYLATPQVEVVNSSQIYALCIGTRTNGGPDKDFRGDLAAIDMANILKKYIKNDYNVIPLAKDVTEGIKKSDIQAKINEINLKMKAGDLLLIYITGHGGSGNDNQGDAYVIIGPDQSSLNSEGILSDSDLYTYLKVMDDKSKWVMIDACHSGGFWGLNSLNDDGGLERLKKIGFLAATWNPFGDVLGRYIVGFIAGGSKYFPNYYGLFTYALKDAFSLTSNGKPKAAGDDGILSIEKLYSYVHFWGGWQEWLYDWNVTYGEMAFGDPFTFTLDKWNPGCGKTDDVKGIKISHDITPILGLLLSE
jgi:hypothetical protein